jgi:hypothetical protein
MTSGTMTPRHWVQVFAEAWVRLAGGTLTVQDLLEVAAERYEHDCDKDPADAARQHFAERSGAPLMVFCDNLPWWVKPFDPMPQGWHLEDGRWRKD